MPPTLRTPRRVGQPTVGEKFRRFLVKVGHRPDLVRQRPTPRTWFGGVLLRMIFCDPHALAMRTGAHLARAKFTLLSRSGPTSRTANGEHLLRAEFFCHTNLDVQKLVNQTSSPCVRSYDLLTTDMGRLCRKEVMSALFICKPPL